MAEDEERRGEERRSCFGKWFAFVGQIHRNTLLQLCCTLLPIARHACLDFVFAVERKAKH